MPLSRDVQVFVLVGLLLISGLAVFGTWLVLR